MDLGLHIMLQLLLLKTATHLDLFSFEIKLCWYIVCSEAPAGPCLPFSNGLHSHFSFPGVCVLCIYIYIIF
jgi:hypothetical protein